MHGSMLVTHRRRGNTAISLWCVPDHPPYVPQIRGYIYLLVVDAVRAYLLLPPMMNLYV